MIEALSSIKEDGRWGILVKTERNKKKDDKLLMFSLSSYTLVIGINRIVPEPHPQTKRKADYAAMDNKKFGVQNNA